jgi:hypothetical protein
MSILTYTGKIVTANGKIVLHVVPPPPPQSTVFLSYLDLANDVGLIKSLDSGVSFSYTDASAYHSGYPIATIVHDPSGDVLLCGTVDGWLYTYKNGVFDSSTHLIPNGFGDIQVRGNIRVCSNGYTGAIVPF